MKTHLIDLHNDAITALSPKNFAEYILEAEKAGVETILISIWTTEMQEPLQQIKHYRHTVDSISTRVKLLLHIEDAWFVNELNICELISYKPFSIGLTWNENNNLAGGANADGKLTPIGKAMIETLSANGIIIDLAHLNKSSFYEAAELLNRSDQKLLCTHACFDEVKQHPRNLDHRQIQTIIDSGGLIGLTLVGDFLSSNKPPQMHDVLSHIEYFIESFGEDNLAIGTDFFGTKNLPEGISEYKDFKRLRKFLIKKGVSDTTIDKIFYGNAKKFLDSYNSL